MGVPKTKWSPEEEEALRKGVKKYGAGKWRFIQKDPVLGKILNQRSNVDLKDKWRNMYPGHSTADPTPDSDDDDRKSGSRSRGKSAGGRAASDSGGSHHRRGAANKDSGKRAVTPGVATKDTPNKDGSASKRRKAPVSEKPGGDVKAGDVKAGAAGDDPFLFLVNGQYRTAEEVTRDAARAVRDAERAAAAAEEAAEEAELCEREAWEAERLANELLEEAERQKLISDAARREAEAAVKAGGPASQPGAGASTIFAV